MKLTQSQLGAFLHAGRRSAASTEIVLELATVDLQCFWIELWNLDSLLGYGRFELVPRPEGSCSTTASFVLAELRAACSPAPGPIVSLSGVLWNRQAALAASAQPPFSLLEEEWIVKPRAQSCREGCLHES